jgi:hypothetical protein
VAIRFATLDRFLAKSVDRILPLRTFEPIDVRQRHPSDDKLAYG